MAETTGGRWVTIRGAHVFLKDGAGGVREVPQHPLNLRKTPPTHAPGHENRPRTATIGIRPGHPAASEPIGGHRPGWMAASNARQIAKSERLARSFKPPGKPVPKGAPMPKMKPMPKGDPIRSHQHRDDVSAIVRHYG